MCVCLCVRPVPSVLQPEKQEDGTVTGKDRWRRKLLSTVAAGIPVTPLPPLTFFLLSTSFSFFSSSSSFLLLSCPLSCFPADYSPSVLLFLSSRLASTVLPPQVFISASFSAYSSILIKLAAAFGKTLSYLFFPLCLPKHRHRVTFSKLLPS